MNIIHLLALAFLPAFIWAGIFVYKKRLGTSLFSLTAAFFAAVMAILFVFAFQQVLSLIIDNNSMNKINPAAIFFQSFISAAFIEESSKVLSFWSMNHLVASFNKHKIFYAKKDINMNHNDMLFLAVFFGLVFSGFENIFYGIRYPQFSLIRLCTASVLHGALGVFFILIISAETTIRRIRYFIKAIFLHGIYNVFVTIGGWFFILAAIVIYKVCLYSYQLKNKNTN